MVENLCCKVDSIRNISFYKYNSEKSPREIFSEIYAPLEEVIKLNQKREMSQKQRGAYKYCFQPERAIEEEMVYEARDRIKQSSYPYIAKIGLENGNIVTYRINPRTNFSDSLLKTPNIVYLSQERNSPPIILREGLDRGQEEIFEKNARKTFGTKYHGKLKKDSKLNPSEVYFIPEPRLLLGLEEVYSREIAKRITPEIKIVDSKENNLWYLRGFLPSFRDSSIEDSQLGKYHGILSALGLIDSLDNQLEHYCLEGGNIVQIDPDYLVYSINHSFGNQTGFESFKNTFPDFFNRFKGKKIKEKRQQEINAILEKMDGDAFHNYIPENISDSSSFQRLKIN